ncbi:CidA/LrgA family protein [Microbulbifer sp.]|uniref:CidA/LrgA family protein n=1 Tax=Microbulbifer sp. TaxID=1908541 RepID=UPI0025908BBA|nr:CidA/LrgA family protein [Microbulbifer sp.]
MSFRSHAQWLGGATLLLLCELLGRALVDLLSLPIPGSVVGMVLLLVGLLIYGKVPNGLARVSELLLRFLVLIFLPASVGIYFLRDLSPRDWIVLMTAMVIGTLVSLTLTALLLNRLIQRSNGRQQREQGNG